MPAPIFIPSKGRADNQITARHLDQMGVPFRVLVEEQEAEEYAGVLGDRVVVVPQEFRDEYDLCHLEGVEYRSKAPGSGASRNYAWQLAEEEGAPWHWVIDDNVRGFHVANRNSIVMADTGLWFDWIEYMASSYANVMMAGPTYEMFVAATEANHPMIINTRVYSCNLIRTSAPFRWRGQFNEDTILSIDMLKAGYCTLLFKHYVAAKIRTGVVKGGNEELYSGGTAEKSRMLFEQHPDVTELVEMYGRDHHRVNYRAYAGNRLKMARNWKRRAKPADMRVTGPADPADQSPRAELLLEWMNSGAGDAT